VSIPTIDHKGTVIKFLWKEEQLEATIYRLIRGKDGTIKGQLVFSTTNKEYHPHLLGPFTYNFSSPLAQSKTRTEMSTRYKEKTDWKALLEQLSALTAQELDKGEPAHEVWTVDETKSPEYKLYPLLFKDEINLLFAQGGSGKSTVSHLIVACISMGWKDNPLYLVPQRGKVLFCDWESSRDTTSNNIKRITRGHNLPDFGFHYQKFDDALIDVADKIYETVMDNGIDTIIIDSVSGATAGDKNDSNVATPFFNVMRKFNCTVLLIDHISKDQFGKRKGASGPTGSVTYWNRPRSIWELVQTQDPKANQINIALFHRKSNLSRLYDPIGMSINYDDKAQTTVFSSISINSIPQIEIRLPLRKRIINALKRGPMSVEELAAELDDTQSAVRARLNEMRDDSQAMKLDNKKWGLAAHEF
jgi:DNA-binding transcriptional ArsR family regulator